MKNCYKTMLLIFLTLIFTLPASAENSTVQPITTTSCKNYANSTSPFMLVLNSGDQIIKSINKCAKEANLTAASISGLGLLKNPEFSYLDQKTKKFNKRLFPGSYELIVLYGTINKAPDRSYADIHAVVSDDRYVPISGHLEEATALVRVDVIFTPLKTN